jgi:hypothetical protein
MTYLVEYEQAALVLPARFLARIHPHFREVMPDGALVRVGDRNSCPERRDRPACGSAAGR